MTYSQYDKPVTDTMKEGIQDTKSSVFGKEPTQGSGEQSFQGAIQDKLQKMAHQWRDDIMEPFEDRSDQNEVERTGKNLVDKTKEQASHAKQKIGGMFQDSTHEATPNEHESYQEMLQDKIDQGTNSIKDITHKVKEEIMETFGDRSHPNDMKQAGEQLRDKTKEQASKVQSTWNENFTGSNENKRMKDGSHGFDEGFKTFGQEAKEQYEMDQRQAEEVKAEWGNAFQSVKHSVKDALGMDSETNPNRELNGNTPDYRSTDVLRESAGGAIVPPFDPTNEPYTEGNAISFTKTKK
ncbi:hypothetical protein FisN_16Lh267 [Fistulifera solaris]|uniref:Uncharacterized protein n=1 Tax=Fistulifera solaris TaxID=1519565 RepID=A0A1Z5J6F9_FISSO|nr:hypothetical protein FisN_16Lh267 [Fistulifera solaris]|eukprot:GAX09570.1 hypothetical protein FisN_16Lh267 [Fistulifera solaris]